MMTNSKLSAVKRITRNRRMRRSPLLVGLLFGILLIRGASAWNDDCQICGKTCRLKDVRCNTDKYTGSSFIKCGNDGLKACTECRESSKLGLGSDKKCWLCYLISCGKKNTYVSMCHKWTRKLRNIFKEREEAIKKLKEIAKHIPGYEKAPIYKGKKIQGDTKTRTGYDYETNTQRIQKWIEHIPVTLKIGDMAKVEDTFEDTRDLKHGELVYITGVEKTKKIEINKKAILRGLTGDNSKYNFQIVTVLRQEGGSWYVSNVADKFTYGLDTKLIEKKKKDVWKNDKLFEEKYLEPLRVSKTTSQDAVQVIVTSNDTFEVTRKFNIINTKGKSLKVNPEDLKVCTEKDRRTHWKRAAKNAKRPTCTDCGERFTSRNQLFKHLGRKKECPWQERRTQLQHTGMSKPYFENNYWYRLTETGKQRSKSRNGPWYQKNKHGKRGKWVPVSQELETEEKEAHDARLLRQDTDIRPIATQDTMSRNSIKSAGGSRRGSFINSYRSADYPELPDRSPMPLTVTSDRYGPSSGYDRSRNQRWDSHDQCWVDCRRRFLAARSRRRKLMQRVERMKFLASRRRRRRLLMEAREHSTRN